MNKNIKIDKETLEKLNELTEAEREHETEKAIDNLDFDFDYEIKNRGLDELKKDALEIVRDVENYEGGFDDDDENSN